MSRHGRVVALVAASLALGGVSVIPMTSYAAEPDPIATYTDRAGVPLTIHRTTSGEADFIGAKRAAAEPLGASVAPGKAARTHLGRAGDALGTDDLDLREQDTTAAVGGGSVTRFGQYVDGLPVLGGEVVLGLDEERGLTSASTNLSDVTSAKAAIADRADAAKSARTVVSKAHHAATGLRVAEEGTWLYDDDLIRGPRIGETSVYRFTVTNDADIRETVLVHAGSGRVLMHINEIAHANRRICDDANVRRDAIGCTETSSTVKRREGEAATGLAEVDRAYDMIGATSDLYASLGLDLTEEIGWSTATSPAVTATTRYCEPTAPDYTPSCPMDNAFWNGQQIYLGQGLAVDDIVAHELTHGVIERSSNLFYWYESGAINESLADVMGEIVDHRYATPDDSPTDWRVGEDSSLGAIRSLASPTAYRQPDRMTSSLWDADDLTYHADGGGVHTNSGVGNKTAYLISQGGTFNGRTITGIDGDDETLQKTAALYLYTIQHLVSGSQYADLGRTLVTGCAALASAGTAGFTTADCTQVRLATEATELAKSPTKAGATRPAEAPNTCPAGSVDKVAAPTPTTSLGGLWHRAPDAADGVAANDRDGNGSDFGWNPDPAAYGDPTASGLTTAGIKVPSGKRTYLRFSHWYLFEWYPGGDPAHPTPQYYDGGEARLLVNGVATAIPSSAWVNGPKQKLLLNSPTKPMTGFGGDSNGWISSRVDMSAYAGKTVQLQWVVRGDNDGSLLGWYVDGLELYSCTPKTIANTAAPKISGSQRVGYTLTSSKGSWSPTATTVKYQWMRNGVPISRATGSTYKLTGSDHAKTIHVKVTAYSSAWPAANVGSRWSSGTGKILAGYLTPVTPSIRGTRKVGYLLTALRGEWKPAGVTYSYQWLRNGKVIPGATGKTYRLKSIDRHDRIRVRVTGRKTGYYTKSRLSAATTVIR
ncbi:M4 family metallopeptidase [Nocardioides sp.]|uniref:M4 family metallopeptidase n=1 Tax=Nocardioides sp. TaxID=35761 RepID=UPI0019B8240B|nr:M4 family metallopeptidase [Nocardioides sp.]MBC7278895.1 M4 family metallopeptidase [Nocardioides sp.]